MLSGVIRADRPWFTFAFENNEPGLSDLSVYAFHGEEKISDSFAFSIELISRNRNLNLTKALGQEALLTVEDRSGKKRLVHGVIRQIEQLHTANVYTHYRCDLVPRLWFLTQTTDHRIYQWQSVPQIIEAILLKNNFHSGSFAFKLRDTYQEREYCVQYGESDFHFICRLAEEEGIYFYHEHSEKTHCLCFSDAEDGPRIPGENSLRFYPGSGNPADTAVISRLHLNHRINSDSATFREWNFTMPRVDLTGHQDEPEWEQAPIPIAMPLESYQFPHLYQTKDEGERYAYIQLLRQLSFRQWIECESDVSRYMPGFTFSVHEHPRDDVNSFWWVVAVRHEGKQPGVLEHESPDDRGLEYVSKVTAIPYDTRFVPEQEHKKVRIEGVQSAIVTGLNGEEIFPDKYGRVKVQFFWDRDGRWDERTSCWVRVAQGWAGGQYGAMIIPRIGHEVVVSFQDGDPDRPLITGSVYHELNQAPYELPANKTRSVIFKSFTTPKNGGFNELRVEDMLGVEEVYLRAEKDANVFVKNDWSDQVCADSHHLTGKDSFTRTLGETHRILEGNRLSLLGKNDHSTVAEDSILRVGKRCISVSGAETQILSNGVIMLEAVEGISLRCGNSVITLTPEDIIIDSDNLWLNCGVKDVVKTTEFSELEVKPPKGADFGSRPAGGEMAKPMPPKQRGVAGADSPDPRSSTAAQGRANSYVPPSNNDVPTDKGLMRNGIIKPAGPSWPPPSAPTDNSMAAASGPQMPGGGNSSESIERVGENVHTAAETTRTEEAANPAVNKSGVVWK